MIDQTLAQSADRRSARSRLLTGLSLALISALAWLASFELSGEMSMPVDIPLFVAVWTVMMTAMMLPSELPALWLFATVAQARARFGFRPAQAVILMAGYLLVWSLMGIGVALLSASAGSMPEAPSQSIVGYALVIAGVYQVTRWKSLCLGHCRTPLHYFMEHWRDGVAGALRMGAHHGLYCVGCCWGLMLALIALGMMNPVWMASIALLVFVEKVVPGGDRLARFAGAGLILAGMAIAFGLIPLQPMVTMTMEGM
jgi:predicted metal-binding membrane protein